MFIYLSYRLLKIIPKLSKKEILRNFSLYLYSQKIDEDDKKEKKILYIQEFTVGKIWIILKHDGQRNETKSVITNANDKPEE